MNTQAKAERFRRRGSEKVQRHAEPTRVNTPGANERRLRLAAAVAAHAGQEEGTMIEKLALVEEPGGKYPPDILLPAQQARSRAATPEETLISAVLEDAIDCVRKHRGVQTRRGQRLFREAADWFCVEQPDWPFSFERICACLGLDADAVRGALGLGSAADRRADTYAATGTSCC